MTELLQRLSEAVPELGLSWMQSNFLYCGQETDGVWAIGTNGVMCPVELNIGRVVLIAAIRDWIVGHGWTLRRSDGPYDGETLYMWEVRPDFQCDASFECDSHDELRVAIECALAVKEKK